MMFDFPDEMSVNRLVKPRKTTFALTRSRDGPRTNS
jgi:hypothetical protein